MGSFGVCGVSQGTQQVQSCPFWSPCGAARASWDLQSPAGWVGQANAGLVPSKAATPHYKIPHDLTHNHTHRARARARTHTHKRIICYWFVMVVNFFVFFSLFTLQKERAGSCRTDKRTNITKILQFVKISSALSVFMNERTRLSGKGGGARSQLVLWNSLIFSPFPTNAE